MMYSGRHECICVLQISCTSDHGSRQIKRGKQINGKYLLDIPKINEDILLNYGVNPHNMQVSNLCSYEYSSILHSYRRDGKKSGRALGIIAMRGSE